MQALKYAARPLPVLKYLGQLCFMLALLTALPLVVSAGLGDYSVSLRYLIIFVFVLTAGLFLRRLPTPRAIQTNEAMIITALAFLLASLIMIWPFMGAGLNFLDAIFETISGVTTTGLSVIAPVADKPASFLFARAWMQWYGGLGFVVFSLAVMVQPVLAAKRIGITEDYQEDLFMGGGTYARRILIVYGALTGLAIFILGLIGTGWFNALLYSLSAVSTGGFSPQNDSIGAFGQWTQFTIIVVSMAGAFPLVLYYRIFRRGWRTAVTDRQLQGFLIAGVIVTVLLALSLKFQEGFPAGQALVDGFLVGFSAQSTTGFSSIGIGQLGSGTKFILILAMFLGGGSGSTSGGIKILRLLILLRVVYLLIQRAGMPRQAVAEANLSGHRIEPDEIQNALGIILAFFALVGVSWLPFLVMGYNPINSLFDVVSAVSTTGLSTGITSPGLAPVLKGILCIDMLLGRLEIFAWLILVYPGSWIGRRLEEQ